MMEPDLFGIIRKKMELKEINVNDYSPLTLAYIGDGIYEIVVRTIIVDEANRQVNKIHKASSQLVKAQSQAGSYLIDVVKDTYRETCFSACGDAAVHLAELGNDAGMFGSAALIIK